MNRMDIARQSRMVLFGAIALALSACAMATGPCPLSSSLAEPGPEKIFASPDEAASALVDANRHNDKTALLEILGPYGSKIISSGDPIADKKWRSISV